jgi:sugar phosphate isomerase/epimerase
MVKCGNWPVGVCSWSLRTGITGVADAMKRLEIDHVNLAIRAAIEEDGADYIGAVRKQTWTISSTMIDFPQEDYSSLETIRKTGGIAPDECWARNRELFFAAAELTAKLGAKYVLMHAGFIDHTDPAYAKKFYGRIESLADAAAKNNITLLLETGQETASQLKHFLEQLSHPAIAVNFDPANMILYDKDDPIEAVRTLAPWIKHIHIKDAIRTNQPGTWGAEVPWGQGQVGTERFLTMLKDIGYDGVLAIEREAGDDIFGDIKLAVGRLKGFSG